MEGSRLAVDPGFASLARRMRTLGLDVIICQARTPVEVLVFCRKERRILLTKDKSLADVFKKYNQECLLVGTEEEGLKIVLERFGTGQSRCPFCNEELLSVQREEVLGKVPVYVFLSMEKFSKCPKCGRIFWKGSHLRWIEEVIGHDPRRTEENTGNKDCGKRHEHS